MTNSSELIDLQKLSRIKKRSIPTNMDRLVELGQDGLNRLESLLETSTQRDKQEATVKLNDVKVLAPIQSPPKIICLGLNYRDHVAEQQKAVPDEPNIFMKPHTAVIGPDDFIIKPSFVRELDYEAELAVIIGRKGKNISVKDAAKHVFGYTCFNDVSARDIQSKDKQWTRGKSFDTFAPMGPCITTSWQIGDPTRLRVQTWVNGELRQNGSTSSMVFNVYQIVHEISRVMTLEPCDVIATGTPAGVGFMMKPKPRFLEEGDVVEIKIENVGKLRNRIAT